MVGGEEGAAGPAETLSRGRVEEESPQHWRAL